MVWEEKIKLFQDWNYRGQKYCELNIYFKRNNVINNVNAVKRFMETILLKLIKKLLFSVCQTLLERSISSEVKME
jgi:hypothetical protein